MRYARNNGAGGLQHLRSGHARPGPNERTKKCEAKEVASRREEKITVRLRAGRLPLRWHSPRGHHKSAGATCRAMAVAYAPVAFIAL
mmetsp:Transcript_37378/g.93369  ORF Transcript_37378/g.93369 Transcript_37378/m.93369 type:complete len:87 (+) Transcript_37378:163-423(+)